MTMDYKSMFPNFEIGATVLFNYIKSKVPEVCVSKVKLLSFFIRNRLIILPLTYQCLLIHLTLNKKKYSNIYSF